MRFVLMKQMAVSGHEKWRSDSCRRKGMLQPTEENTPSAIMVAKRKVSLLLEGMINQNHHGELNCSNLVELHRL